MLALDEKRIQEIVERVLERLGSAPPRAPLGSGGCGHGQPHPGERSHAPADVPPGKTGLHDTPDEAVAAARRGFEANERAPLALRAKMIQAMRDTTRQHVRELARFACEETGLGRVECKIAKNLLVVERTPGVEILRPVAQSGDDGLTITERAPYGVIAAVTPCTNPTETILCNAIGMVAGGNAVVFHVHPSAARTSAWHVHLLGEAIRAVGGPADVITTVASPTIESAQALMKHAGVRLLTVTGGPGVVKEAMASGKKAICAGPGNPPAVVDETAHLEAAARALVLGASADNNIICVSEKEILAVSSIADRLKEELVRAGCLLVSGDKLRDLEKATLGADGPQKKLIGKNAAVLAKAAGLGSYGDDLRLLLCDVDEAHPFVQHEMLMPVLPLVRVRDAEEGIAAAKRVEHGFGHTATMHSTHLERLAAMARTIDTSIFVKNAPSLAGLGLGGEGYTSFTIASPTAVHFTRERRCTLKDAFRFV